MEIESIIVFKLIKIHLQKMSDHELLVDESNMQKPLDTTQIIIRTINHTWN